MISKFLMVMCVSMLTSTVCLAGARERALDEYAQGLESEADYNAKLDIVMELREEAGALIEEALLMAGSLDSQLETAGYTPPQRAAIIASFQLKLSDAEARFEDGEDERILAAGYYTWALSHHKAEYNYVLSITPIQWGAALTHAGNYNTDMTMASITLGILAYQSDIFNTGAGKEYQSAKYWAQEAIDLVNESL